VVHGRFLHENPEHGFRRPTLSGLPVEINVN
jgi:hypothetical protein